MQQLLWRTIQATGVTDAAKSATEAVVSMATRKLTEAATAEIERRWVSAAASTDHRTRSQAGGARRPPRSTGPATSDPDQESIRRLRATIAALDARLDTLDAG